MLYIQHPIHTTSKITDSRQLFFYISNLWASDRKQVISKLQSDQNKVESPLSHQWHGGY